MNSWVDWGNIINHSSWLSKPRNICRLGGSPSVGHPQHKKVLVNMSEGSKTQCDFHIPNVIPCPARASFFWSVDDVSLQKNRGYLHQIPTKMAFLVVAIEKETPTYTWWLIPLSKWVITPVINGISRVNQLITGVITHLLSGMSHQVTLFNFKPRICFPYFRFIWGHLAHRETRCWPWKHHIGQLLSLTQTLNPFPR